MNAIAVPLIAVYNGVTGEQVQQESHNNVFGTVHINTNQSMTYTIVNEGYRHLMLFGPPTLRATLIYGGDGAAADYWSPTSSSPFHVFSSTIPANYYALAPAERANFTVTYQPTLVAASRLQLNISTNDVHVRFSFFLDGNATASK
jgi:hypothetical protein